MLFDLRSLDIDDDVNQKKDYELFLLLSSLAVIALPELQCKFDGKTYQRHICSFNIQLT